MRDTNLRLWPFNRSAIIPAVVVILLVLLTALTLLRVKLNWPPDGSQNTALIGILILSVLPIVLGAVDILIARGGVLEYKGIKLDFSRGRDTGTVGIMVATNIGVRSEPLSDTTSEKILGTLGHATSCPVAVVDLEDGQAWWETRLMVLIAGAERLGRPEFIVFVATDAGNEQQFQGWGRARDLLRRLIDAVPQYKRSLQISRTAARQWSLIEPNPNPGLAAPNVASLIATGQAHVHHTWAFDAAGLHNELAAERLLQSDLGGLFEHAPGGPPKMTINRLEELFRPVLLKDHIDLGWPPDRQLTEFLETKADQVAITQGGKYESLASRLTLFTEALKSIVKDRQAA